MDLPRVIAFDGDDTLWHNETPVLDDPEPLLRAPHPAYGHPDSQSFTLVYSKPSDATLPPMATASKALCSP